MNSFVSDILTPLLGLLNSGDLSTFTFKAGDATVAYGKFLSQLLSFILIAAAIFFFVVKPMNAMTARLKKPDEGESPIKACPFCTMDIPAAATRCPNCTSELS